jgi:hypothetical protein
MSRRTAISGSRGDARVAADVAPASGHDDGEGREWPPVGIREAVDDLVDGAVAAHRDHDWPAVHHGLSRQLGGHPRPGRLGVLDLDR